MPFSSHWSARRDNSTVTMVSERGSITIGGKIDHDSRVTLSALGNIRIGEAGNDGGARKIDGNSIVTASAGGTIWLANKIDGGSVSGEHSVVDFQACRGIVIGDKIDGGSQVRLAVHTGTISIGDKIGGGSTRMQYWPAGSITRHPVTRQVATRRRSCQRRIQTNQPARVARLAAPAAARSRVSSVSSW